MPGRWRRTAIALCVALCASVFTGCDVTLKDLLDGETTPSGEGTPQKTRQTQELFLDSKWPENCRAVCGSAPYPQGDLSEYEAETFGADGGCELTFQQVGLQQFIEWLLLFRDAHWHADKTGMHKGPRALTIDYHGNRLILRFKKNGPEGDWPEDMPVYLAAGMPYFPYGGLAESGETQMEGCREAYCCEYEEVGADDAAGYEQTLLDHGFVFKNETGGFKYFEKGFLVAAIAADEGRFLVMTGRMDVQLAPPPPWPDPLPEEFNRILPLIANKRTVTMLPTGYELTVENMYIDDFTGFFQNMKDNGWTGPDGSLMENGQTGAIVTLREYGTHTWKLVFGMSPIAGEGDGTAQPSQTPDERGRDEGFDDGLEDYDFIPTSGKYGEHDALSGAQREFGAGATIADWTEIKKRYHARADEFLDYCGIAGNEDVWVVKDGNPWHDGPRHYFLARIGQMDRGDFLIVDTLGEDAAWLGSWYGLSLRVLAKVPEK